MISYKAAYALAILFILGVIISLMVMSEQIVTTKDNSSNKITVTIVGDSMEPTLHNGEQVTLKYDKNIERLDIVAVNFSRQKDAQVKRVIGLPGDKLEIIDNTLAINGEKFEEDYLSEPFEIISLGILAQQLEENRIPKGYFLVLGDNRRNSLDSRTYGLILEEQIIGKIVR